MIEAAEALAQKVGVATACDVLAVSRATLYRRRAPVATREAPAAKRPSPPRALSGAERQAVLDLLHSDRFVDTAPAAVVATLLDEGIYHCSPRTMHRVLAAHGENGERRAQRTHPPRVVPRLEATAPNQVWSWDITRLPGPTRWCSYPLYVLLDIYSRYVVAWMVAERELARLALRLVMTGIEREQVVRHELSLHQDNGAPMRAKTFWQTLVDMGLLMSYSRPRVSNDNPYSESQFKTLKYMPRYPGRFGSPKEARRWGRGFFEWYNHEHCHSGIAMLTPYTVHSGCAEEALAQRQRTLDEAFALHPERFVNGPPRVAQLPRVVAINSPATKAIELPGPPAAAQLRAVGGGR